MLRKFNLIISMLNTLMVFLERVGEGKYKLSPNCLLMPLLCVIKHLLSNLALVQGTTKNTKVNQIQNLPPNNLQFK